jgi:hypothetical protein
MRSSNKWIIEVVVVSAIMLGLGQVVSFGLARLSPASPPGPLEQILITLYLLLAGLVVELVRWARDSVEQAADSVREVLEDQLIGSAEKAVRGAILRSIFPSGNPDPVNARIHFGIVEDYLRQVEGRPALVQRASGILAKRHLAAWNDEMDDLLGKNGINLKMDESARMSSAMAEGGTKYLNIERSPCDPVESWSPGFLKIIDEMKSRPTLHKKFVLLADPRKLWGAEAEQAEREQARDLFLRETEYLGSRGFQVYFCDERVVHKELGTSDIPAGNFEVFSEQVALQMDAADSYDRFLPVRLRTLSEIGDLRRFLQIVEEQAQKVTSRMIKGGFGE